MTTSYCVSVKFLLEPLLSEEFMAGCPGFRFVVPGSWGRFGTFLFWNSGTNGMFPLNFSSCRNARKLSSAPGLSEEPTVYSRQFERGE
jgi:hypothetical protein